MGGHETDGAKLRSDLDDARVEIARLRDENAALKLMLVEMQRALEAAEGDVARYRAAVESLRPNAPERVPSSAQQLVFESLLASFGETAAANDASPEPPGPPPPEAPPPPAAPAPPAASPDAPPPNPKRGGRRRLDLSALPVETVTITPAEVLAADKVGYTLVSSETADRVAFRPASYFRLRCVRETWRKDRDATATSEQPPDAPDVELITAPIPDALWPRFLADPSAISHAIVSKYDDLLPLHRQEGIGVRNGFVLPRATLCGWLAPACDTLSGIVAAMFECGKATAFCMATDATSASVRQQGPQASAGAEDGPPHVGRPGPGTCEKWHVFVFVADQDHVVFAHSRTHDSGVLGTMLRNYRGYLLGDATSIYSPLVTAGQIVHVACWAHLRRYFYRALDSEPTRAMEGLTIIGRLFAAERECGDLVGDARTRRRADLARPLLQLFDDWVERVRPTLEARTPLQAAVTYADNQRVALRRFLDDGRLRLDNNVCEGQLRHLVRGHDNWQCFANETGLKWYVTFRSLIASCKIHGICPERYLECVLRLAPHWSQRRLLELSPKHWRETAARLTTEQLAIVSPSWSRAFQTFVPPSADDEPASAVAAA